MVAEVCNPLIHMRFSLASACITAHRMITMTARNTSHSFAESLRDTRPLERIDFSLGSWHRKVAAKECAANPVGRLLTFLLFAQLHVQQTVWAFHFIFSSLQIYLGLSNTSNLFEISRSS